MVEAERLTHFSSCHHHNGKLKLLARLKESLLVQRIMLLHGTRTTSYLGSSSNFNESSSILATTTLLFSLQNSCIGVGADRASPESVFPEINAPCILPRSRVRASKFPGKCTQRVNGGVIRTKTRRRKNRTKISK